MPAILAPYFDLLDQRNPLSYLAAGVFLFVFVVVLRATRRGRGFRFKALLRFVFPRSVYGHVSARLDYKLYLLNMPLMALFFGSVIIGVDGTARVVGSGLDHLSGAVLPVTAPWPVSVAIAVAMLLALDFGYWISHFALHRSPVLWQFHKLHHSAEVMTPATEFRQHPVELIFMPCVMSIASGLVLAVSLRTFGPAATRLGTIGFNVVLFVHLSTFHHLRHSHIVMPFTGVLGRLLHSPAHHLVHHSVEPAHHNRNMGYILSVWDWAFGTLHVPQPNQRLVLGIGPHEVAHRGMVDALVRPVRDAWQIASARRVAANDPSANPLRR